MSTDDTPPGSVGRLPPAQAPGPQGTVARDTAGISRPKLLDQVRTVCRVRHLSRRTEEAYVGWIRRFILFHRKQHPLTLGAPDVSAFLSSLAIDNHVSASTQNQALNALLFLYRSVLHRELERFVGVVRARTPVSLPVVLTRDEVRRVLAALEGVPRLVACLLYGAGLRLLEALELRVKDLDLDRAEITVRRGKGQKDRRTVLPATVVPALRDHLAHVQAMHNADLARGFGRVVLPDALRAKYPNAGRSWPLAVRVPRGAHLPNSSIYTHVLNRGGRGVRSPADSL